MTRFGWLLFGLLLGAVGVLAARRSAGGRVFVERAEQSLQAFVDGVSEGYREQSR